MCISCTNNMATIDESQLKLKQLMLLNKEFLKQCFLQNIYQVKKHLVSSKNQQLKLLATIIHLVSNGSILLAKSKYNIIKSKKKLNFILKTFSSKKALNSVSKSRNSMLEAFFNIAGCLSAVVSPLFLNPPNNLRIESEKKIDLPDKTEIVDIDPQPVLPPK